MLSKNCSDNLPRSHSDSSRGIAGRGVAMQATERDLSKINCYYCNNFGHYKNDCTDFKAAHDQNRRRRQRHHKQRGGHQPEQPKPGGQRQQRGGGKIWCSYHKTTTHNDADCRATPANGLNGNAHFAVFRAFLGSAVRGTSLCEMTPTRIPASHCWRGVYSLRLSPAAKPAKARVEEEKGGRPFGSVLTAAAEEWRTRPWPFTSRAEPQPVTKPAEA